MRQLAFRINGGPDEAVAITPGLPDRAAIGLPTSPRRLHTLPTASTLFM